MQRGIRRVPDGRLLELEAFLRRSLRPLGEVASVDFGRTGVVPYAGRITVVVVAHPSEPGHR